MAVRTEEIAPPLLERLSATPSTIVGVLAAAICVCLWPSWAALAKIWMTMADYAHGPVVAVGVAAWLYSLRERIDAQPVRPARWALLPLAALIVLWLVVWQGASELLQQAVLPLIVLSAVLAALGTKVFLVVLVPVASLYLAIPVWELVIPILQWMTTQVAETVLGWFGVATIVNGNDVNIPAGRFTVAEGCSGKRYVIIGLVFAVAASALQRLPAMKFASVVGAALALALFTNWLRVIVIIYAGHASDMQHYLVATEHRSLGYALFAPLLLAVLLLARRLGRDEPTKSPPAMARDVRVRVSAWVAPLAVILAPVLASTANSANSANLANAPAPSLGRLPILTGACQGPLPGTPLWRPEFAGMSAEASAAYVRGERQVDVYVNVYGKQTQGRELVHFTNSITPTAHWPSVQSVQRREAQQTFIAHHASSQRWVVTQTYVVGARTTASQTIAQMLYGLHALRRPVPAGVVALASPCQPDCDAAQAAIDEFWSEHGAAIAALVPARM